jgi:cytochrome d ubiquinol oxidase subunit II
MFESLSHTALQHYWWLLISLLGGLLVFLMFVQGGQTLLFSIGKDETKRTMLVNALGRKWEFTFTTLVTFGGAFFASFPLFYSTSFSGAYWVWFIILFAFVIQAVAYEFRSRPNNVFGPKTYEIFLFINGLIGTLLIGTAVATFFTGSGFIVNDMNQSQWISPFRGLEAAFNLHNLSLGLTVFFLARVLGCLYFINTINDEAISQSSIKHLWYNAIPFVFFFLTFTIWLMLRDGFAVDSHTHAVSMEPFKYFTNLIEMPLIAILFVGGVISVLYGIIATLFLKKQNGIWASGAGTIVVVFSLFVLAGFNNTAFYPSSADLQSSLTIENASSSHFTLTAMSYVSLLIPFVAAYIWFAWKAINNKKIDMDEMKSNEIHIY